METKHQNNKKIAHVVVYLTLLTGPLRIIQLWSQTRGGRYIKTNRERTRPEKQNKTRQPSREESRQKKVGVKVGCKGHHHQEGIQEGKPRNKSEINQG